MITRNFPSPCSLVRRLAAIFYDALLLLSLFFILTLILLPFTGGRAIDSGNLPYVIYLLLISYLYFVWQWVQGGQTLGMRAWKIRLIADNNTAVTWRIASKRFFLAMSSWAMLGAGFLWALFDEKSLALHDRYSGTRLIVNTGRG